MQASLGAAIKAPAPPCVGGITHEYRCVIGAPPAAWQGPQSIKIRQSTGSLDCAFWPDQLDHRTASLQTRFRLIPGLENTAQEHYFLVTAQPRQPSQAPPSRSLGSRSLCHRDHPFATGVILWQIHALCGRKQVVQAKRLLLEAGVIGAFQGNAGASRTSCDSPNFRQRFGES